MTGFGITSVLLTWDPLKTTQDHDDGTGKCNELLMRCERRTLERCRQGGGGGEVVCGGCQNAIQLVVFNESYFRGNLTGENKGWEAGGVTLRGKIVNYVFMFENFVHLGSKVEICF